jgi:hypothetical protein
MDFLLTPPATETRFELFFVIIINFIDNNIQYIFVFYNLFELTQNILNEVKHRKVELEQFLKEKAALEEKLERRMPVRKTPRDFLKVLE